MAYDDIQKNLAGWTNFLKEIKKDVSKNHSRNYPNILNGLKKLGKTIRPLEGISSIQNNDVIRRKIDKIENESKDLQDIVSDMIKNPANNNYIKVTEHLDNLIDRCNELPNDLANLSDEPASSEKTDDFLLNTAAEVERLILDRAIILKRFQEQAKTFYNSLVEYFSDQTKTENPLDWLVLPYATTKKALIGSQVDDDYPKKKSIPYNPEKSLRADYIWLTIIHDKGLENPRISCIGDSIWPKDEEWVEEKWNELQKGIQSGSRAIQKHIELTFERVKADLASLPAGTAQSALKDELDRLSEKIRSNSVMQKVVIERNENAPKGSITYTEKQIIRDTWNRLYNEARAIFIEAGKQNITLPVVPAGGDSLKDFQSLQGWVDEALQIIKLDEDKYREKLRQIGKETENILNSDWNKIRLPLIDKAARFLINSHILKNKLKHLEVFGNIDKVTDFVNNLNGLANNELPFSNQEIGKYCAALFLAYDFISDRPPIYEHIRNTAFLSLGIMNYSLDSKPPSFEDFLRNGDNPAQNTKEIFVNRLNEYLSRVKAYLKAENLLKDKPDTGIPAKDNLTDTKQNIIEALKNWPKSGKIDKDLKAIKQALSPLDVTYEILSKAENQSRRTRKALQWLDMVADGKEAFCRTLLNELSSPEVIADLERAAAQRLEANAGQPLKEKQSAIKDKGCWHNEDFTTVIWNGIEYQFNKRQARCIRYLWENESATEKSIGKILDTGAFTPYRLRDTFRNKKGYHDAWGKMIIPAGKGCFKLTKLKS